MATLPLPVRLRLELAPLQLAVRVVQHLLGALEPQSCTRLCFGTLSQLYKHSHLPSSCRVRAPQNTNL